MPFGYDFVGAGAVSPNDLSLGLQGRDWRLACLSAETGARFVRERIPQSPLKWLTVPRRVFNGRSGFQAVDDPRAFEAGMLMHELGLGLDIDPEILSFLPRNAWAALANDDDFGRYVGGIMSRDDSLFCSSICADVDGGQLQIFSAMVVANEDVVRSRLRHRFGRSLEELASVREGFDWSEPLACALVSDAMGDILTLADRDPKSSVAAGLDFEVQQRFSE